MYSGERYVWKIQTLFRSHISRPISVCSEKSDTLMNATNSEKWRLRKKSIELSLGACVQDFKCSPGSTGPLETARQDELADEIQKIDEKAIYVFQDETTALKCVREMPF